MGRFALTITGVMLVLTAGAVGWILWSEAPEGIEFLNAQDLKNIGMEPSGFRDERLAASEGAGRRYACDFAGGALRVEAEARTGATPARFEEELARWQGQAGDGEKFQLKVETFGQESPTRSFGVLRRGEGPGGAQVAAEWWIQEEDGCFSCRVTETGVAPERFAERRDWCGRQARTIAHTMLGHLREARAR